MPSMSNLSGKALKILIRESTGVKSFDKPEINETSAVILVQKEKKRREKQLLSKLLTPHNFLFLQKSRKNASCIKQSDRLYIHQSLRFCYKTQQITKPSINLRTTNNYK